MQLKKGDRGIFIDDDNNVVLGTVTEIHNEDEFDIEFYHGGTASPISANEFLPVESDTMFTALSDVFEKFDAYVTECEIELESMRNC